MLLLPGRFTADRNITTGKSTFRRYFLELTRMNVIFTGSKKSFQSLLYSGSDHAVWNDPGFQWTGSARVYMWTYWLWGLVRSVLPVTVSTVLFCSLFSVSLWMASSCLVRTTTLLTQFRHIHPQSRSNRTST